MVPGGSEPYRAWQRLEVPVDAAWRILTSPAGARRWFAEDSHPGVRVGAVVGLRGSSPAEIDAVSPGTSIGLSFPTGRRATLEFRALGDDRCEIVVTDYGTDGQQAGALAAGWSALLSAARFVAGETKANRRTRQAIVVIHGIGSQRPLSTIRSFTDALVPHSDRWSKPDQLSVSYELRRYQLRRTRTRPRTDLFELYWADKVPGTKLGHIMAWLRSIAFRRPRDVCASLRPIAYLTWAVAVAAAGAVVSLVLTLGTSGSDRLWHAATGFAQVAWISACLSLAGGAINGFLIASLGDAARYLDAAPDNIAVRQSIRQSGVALLRRLHTEGQYDRIAVVGHSLGSVIGYDIIRLYWSEVYLSHGTPLTVDQTHLHRYEQVLGAAPATNEELAAHRRAQRDLWREYRRLGHPWLITDLITIGSPLTHAGTLLARSPTDLDGLIADLELPTCPPHGAPGGLTRPVSYLTDGQIRTLLMPTHAAPFAVTRWTNIYAPTRAIVMGDPIGGPLALIFGRGIKDIPVRVSPWWRRHTPMAHTSYWRRPRREGVATAIPVLTESLDIESRRWLDEHVSEMPWEMSVGHREADELP